MLYLVAAYAAAVLFCLSEDSRKQPAQPGVRTDVSCIVVVLVLVKVNCDISFFRRLSTMFN